MVKPKKTGVVPKLRFPEFRDGSGWIPREIGDVFKVTRGEVLAMPLVQSHPDNVAQYPVYSSQTKNVGLAGYYIDFLYEDAITWTTDGANAGDVNFRQGKFYCTNVCGVLLNKDGFANPCVAALINNVSKNYVSYVGNPKLMNGVMAKIVIPFPSIVEQQKIADCLTSLDELIAAQGRKVEALKTYKRGLMQQLFPREGETVPRLRFPEYQNADEWEHTTVGRLVDIGFLFPPKDGNHGNIHPKSSDYVTKGIPFIMASNLNDGVIDIENCHFISKEQADTLQKGFAKEGDVLLSHKGTVGEVAVVRKIDTPYLMLTPQVTYYRVQDQKKISNEFLAQMFAGDAFQSKLIEVSGGGTRAYIGITEQAKLPLQLPNDIEEQHCIAASLNSLDAQIVIETRKFASLKSHKQALMQQLFPAIEETEA